MGQCYKYTSRLADSLCSADQTEQLVSCDALSQSNHDRWTKGDNAVCMRYPHGILAGHGGTLK